MTSARAWPRKRPSCTTTWSDADTPRTTVQSAEEGLLVSLDQRGVVDLPYIATLYNAPVRQIIAELGDLIYQDPDTQAWQTADVYLSGNVRAKLAAAERAGSRLCPQRRGPARWCSRRMCSLATSMPTWARPGSPRRTSRPSRPTSLACRPTGLTVAHLKTRRALERRRRASTTVRSVAATTDYGTDRANGVWLLEQALNLKSPTIYDVFERDGKEERVLNQEETLAAREKQTAHQRALSRLDLRRSGPHRAPRAPSIMTPTTLSACAASTARTWPFRA